MLDFNLMDKLKALNFDEEFRRDIKMKPMSRYYFCVSSNPAEQFHVFTCLGAWLSGKCGKPMERPQEDDDPNFTISSLLDTARELGISVDFSPNKLKQGYGEYVMYILDKLTEKALQNVKYDWQSLKIEPENQSELGNGTEDGIDDQEEVEEEEEGVPEEALYSDDSEEDGYAADTNNINDHEKDKTSLTTLHSDALLWQQEVERVGPSLRVRVAASARDWRAHLQHLITHRQELGALSSKTGGLLTRLSARAGVALEAARSRDTLLADRLSKQLNILATLRANTDFAASSYKAVSGGVTQRQEVLAELTDKVEAVKQKMEMKGSSMNDASPVVNIRRAVVNLRKEIQQVDLQLAVLMWSVTEYQCRAGRTA